MGSIVGALPLRPRDEPVRIARIRLTQDAIEGEVDPRGRPGSTYPLIDGRGALCTAELRSEVLPAIDAVARQVGVELERVPMHRRHGLARRGELREGRIQTPLADEAPGTHDVGDHVDAKRRRWGHCRLRFETSDLAAEG